MAEVEVIKFQLQEGLIDCYMPHKSTDGIIRAKDWIHDDISGSYVRESDYNALETEHEHIYRQYEALDLLYNALLERHRRLVAVTREAVDSCWAALAEEVDDE